MSPSLGRLSAASLKEIGALIDFVDSLSGVVLAYRSGQPDNDWVWSELLNHNTVTLGRAFCPQPGVPWAVSASN